jgi:aspartyl-tRNA(Asn)/glutamyl-tRNA(Gln) amidotransferase subunit C
MSQPVLDVHKVARLARLDLTEEEAVQYQAQLGKVLDYMSALERHDLSDVEPTQHAMPIYDVWREDVSTAGFTMPEALANAPRKSSDQFLMPRVVEE